LHFPPSLTKNKPLQIFASQPLFPHLKSTPSAGSRLTHHLRALLLLFGTYMPPPTLSGAANIPTQTRSTRISEEMLTDAIVEEIETRCCFVGTPLDASPADVQTGSPIIRDVEMILANDGTQSKSEFSHSSRCDSNVSSHRALSDFSSFSHQPRVTSNSGNHHHREGHLQALATLYKRHSSATDLQLRVDLSPSHQLGIGRGTWSDT
jgi:actin-related protein 10